MKRNTLWVLAGLLIGCAPSRPHPISPAKGVAVDALLPAGRNLFVFDFARSRYQRWSLADTCGLADTLRGGWSKPANWLSLAFPGSPFAPIKAAPGPNGHFFLLDRIGRRIGLYDTNAQFLSAFPLPQELKDRNPERLELHWTRDGIFTFLDLSEGTAWQYMEVRSQAGSSGGQGDWRLVNRIRLPVALETCLWEPFFRNPCCRMKSGTGGMTCFDRYFNPRGATSSSAESDSGAPGGPAVAGPADSEARLRAIPDGRGAGWNLVIGPGPGCGESDPPRAFCFQPDRGVLAPCPAPLGDPGRSGP